jgi:hypothetical protein
MINSEMNRLNTETHRRSVSYLGVLVDTDADDTVTGVNYAVQADAAREQDLVNHPQHYNSHPSGVECITVVEHMGFNIGNAVEYLWRADHKDNAVEDLRKAAWYLNREINRLRIASLRDVDAQMTQPLREPTQAEKNIARAWVERHRFTNPKDAEVEYEHALSILVFGNARPPLKNRR